VTRRRRTSGPGSTGPGSRGDTSAPATLESQLARLASMAIQDLRAEWQRLHRAVPPNISRDLWTRGIAYKIQERASGGSDAALKRRLNKLASELANGSGASRVPTLKPGARLVREWRGRVHSVTVTEVGFEYAGQRYRSLSQIARTITGAHWSGPRFFGLNKAAGKVGRAEVPDADPGAAGRHSP
jgi:hypothetical protein